MKYYIRTLRANLDNILSSESISPVSFYQKRGYGYRRLERLKGDNDDYALRIYTRIFDDGEDVVFIEIDGGDVQLKDVSRQNGEEGLFLIKPFYLYPWNCRILFKSIEDAKDSAFICRSSLTNKMWNYYQTGIVVNSEVHGKSGEMSATSFVSDNSGLIELDKRRNSLKGFLFAYYLGLFKSLSSDLAKLLQSEIHIYGLATVMAGMRYPSKEMMIEIDRHKKTFNSYDPNRALLKKRWEEDVLSKFSTHEDAKWFEYLMVRFDVQKTAMDAFAAEQGFASSPRLDTANMIGMNWRLFASQIETYTQRQIGQYVESKQLSPEQLLSFRGGETSSFDSLYRLVLNEIINGNQWLSTERIGSKRMEVANELTYFVKEHYESQGVKWEGSVEQAYMDGMRQNIANSAPFDPNQISNNGLRALVLFILKGDLVGEMMKYMQVAGVEDYSLVLGLWGASVGYAGIPKTFIQEASFSNRIISECYRYTNMSLTDEQINNELDQDSFVKVLTQPVTMNKIHSKQDDLETALLQLRQTPLRMTDVQVDSIKHIILRNNGRVDENGFLQISQIKGIGKKKLEQIRVILKPFYIQESELLFKEIDVKAVKQVFSLKEVLRVIMDCLPEEGSVRIQVGKDVKWFWGHNRDTKENMIIRLCDFLNRKKSASSKRNWTNRVYDNVDVNLIESKLRETFL